MDQVTEKTLRVRERRDRLNAGLLRYLIKRSGLTVEGVAVKAGLTSRTVYNGLNGFDLTIESLCLIADALGAWPHFLLNRDLPESQYHRAIRQDGNKADSAVVDRSSMGDRGRSKSSVRTKSKAAA